MTSMAERLRKRRAASKAGRPRKENVERYPSGKIKPAETEREAISVVVEARKRIYGLETKDPKAGYLLGRMEMDGKITESQLEAGDEFALAISRYYRLTGIAFPSARAQSLFSIKGHDGETTESEAARARDAANRMMALRGALLQCVDGPQVSSTVWNVAVMDMDHLRDMPAQQVLWLRRGLEALKNSGLLPNTRKMEMAS